MTTKPKSTMARTADPATDSTVTLTVGTSKVTGIGSPNAKPLEANFGVIRCSLPS